MAHQPNIERLFGAVNIGSFRVSAMIAGIAENGEMQVLGSGHRMAQGIRRGYVTDMAAATYAVRDALEKAEKLSGHNVSSVWIGSSGAGLASRVDPVEIEIGGRRIEEEDVEQLLMAAQDVVQPDGRMVLHAHPACYFLDGADGVANPVGLHAERLGVDIHSLLADGAPMRNVREAVESAHLDVEGIVASPLAAGYAVLSEEERDLGAALVEMGAEVTNVAVYAAGMLVGLASIPRGSGDITDSVASAFGIRRFQAERLKCVNGSAVASPADRKEMIPVAGPNDDAAVARGTDDRGRIPRSDLIEVITSELASLMTEVGRALETLGYSSSGTAARQVVLTGGGAELAGLADYAQSALGMPVRIGRAPSLRGLPEAHATPGFATLAGLVLYAADEPADIRSVGAGRHKVTDFGWVGQVRRVVAAMKEHF